MRPLVITGEAARKAICRHVAQCMPGSMEGPEDFGFYGVAEMSVTAKKQSIVDAFYKHHGPCCAGCDWWRWHNTLVGECTRTVPVSGADRYSMLGINWSSLIPGAGHIMTKRDHVCGEFIDTGSKA